jgi:hypothetical protein
MNATGKFAHLILLLGAIFALPGCGPQPPSSISDPRLAPFIKAIEAADRAPLGFSPIPTNARIQLDEGGKAPYDAMLHTHELDRGTPHSHSWKSREAVRQDEMRLFFVLINVTAEPWAVSS